MRTMWMTAGAALCLSMAACGDAGLEEATGTATANITVVPAGVRCIQVEVVGSRTVTRTASVTGGQSSALLLSGLPTGAVTVTGRAYEGTCASLSSTSVAAWVSDPERVQVQATGVANVSLSLRRAGQLGVDVDFDKDGGVVVRDGGVSAPPSYPYGAGGLGVGQIFPAMTFEGYRDGQGAYTNLSLRDDYDPDGDRGVRALYILVCAAWCAPCRQEAAALPRMYRNRYAAQGARFLTVMVEGPSPGQAASRTDLDAWVAQYRINHDIGLGTTAALLANPAGASYPTNYVVDPRTMVIQEVVQGYRSLEPRCLTTSDCGDETCDPLTNVCYPATLPGPLGSVDALLLRNGAPSLL